MGYDFNLGTGHADIVCQDRVYTGEESLLLAKRKIQLEKEGFRLIFRDDPKFGLERLSNWTDVILADAGIKNYSMFPGH